jgi:hypothetical protein
MIAVMVNNQIKKMVADAYKDEPGTAGVKVSSVTRNIVRSGPKNLSRLKQLKYLILEEIGAGMI